MTIKYLGTVGEQERVRILAPETAIKKKNAGGIEDPLHIV